MQYALISPDEKVTNIDGSTGYRVCDAAFTKFDVAPPLFWFECETIMVPDRYYYDPVRLEIKEKPANPIPKQTIAAPADSQPVTSGTQSF
jgi:hypothetical protein